MTPSTRWNRLRYTLYAPVYDLAVARLPLFRRGRRRSLALAAIRPGERVLLVAAGTGLDLEVLPDGVEVVATDITPAMVARLGERVRALRESGRDLRVQAEVMDAGRLALPDTSVDCVVLPGTQGARCLIFENHEVVRRVWDFPATWTTLPAAALFRLVGLRP